MGTKYSLDRPSGPYACELQMQALTSASRDYDGEERLVASAAVASAAQGGRHRGSPPGAVTGALCRTMSRWEDMLFIPVREGEKAARAQLRAAESGHRARRQCARRARRVRGGTSASGEYGGSVSRRCSESLARLRCGGGRGRGKREAREGKGCVV